MIYLHVMEDQKDATGYLSGCSIFRPLIGFAQALIFHLDSAAAGGGDIQHSFH